MPSHCSQVVRCFVCAIAVLFAPGVAWSQDNSVIVESKEVLPGATNVTVGVYISNQVRILAMTMPLEFREITPGAYMQNQFSQGMPTTGRLWSTWLADDDPDGPPRSLIERVYSVPSLDLICSGPISKTYQVPIQEMDFTSPDALLFYAYGPYDDQIPRDDVLEPGTEVPGLDIPSYRLEFEVTDVTGQFEIDTCCVRPFNHLMFENTYSQIITPTFTKGIISIGCFCHCHGDPECDGYHDILDVVRAINTAFRGVPEPLDQDCTHSRTDVDVSGVTDVLDVAKMIDVVLNDGSVEGSITDPCANSGN